MTTQNNHPSGAMAQLALTIYDEEGEYAFLSFVAANAVTDDEAQWPEGDEFLCTMADLSTVQRHDEGISLNHGLIHTHYHFTWLDHVHGRTHHTRASAMDMNDAPAPPPPPVSLLDWPNSDTVREQVMLALQQQATGETPTQHGTPPALDRHQSHLAAPELMRKIAQVIRNHQLSEELIHQMNLEQMRLNAKVMSHITEEERQALVAMIRKNRDLKAAQDTAARPEPQ